MLPTTDDVFDSGGDSVTDPFTCGISINCNIVAGSNSIEPIEVTINNVDPSGDIQSKLENAASSTDNPSSNVFGPFPTGGKGFDSGGARNPLTVCQREHGCPTYN